MKITLKSLTIVNFKGIKHLTILFNHITNIYGENGKGKTSILDAFSWLCWDKDSTGRTDFEVQPLDKLNRIIPKTEVEVSAEFDIDGISHEAKKVLRENWVQKRGSTELEKKGNESSYFWNGVPMKLSEYKAKIDSIIKENLFKLITNTLYFNSMKWQDRRTTLMSIAGNISDYEVADQDPEFKKLIALLTNKTLEEYKREISAKKKKLKDEMDPIQSRIDEVQRGKPLPLEFDTLRRTLQEKMDELTIVENSLMDKAQAQNLKLASLREKQTGIHNLKVRLQTIENTVRSSFQQDKLDRERVITAKKNELRTASDCITENNRVIKVATDRIVIIKAEQDTLRQQWTNIDAETLKFEDGAFCCPACKRELDATDIDTKKLELENNFNTNKAKRLNDIVSRGSLLKDQIASLEKTIKNLQEVENENLEYMVADMRTVIGNLEEINQTINSSATSEIDKLINGNVEYSDVSTQIYNAEQEVEIIMKAEVDGAQDALKQQKLTLTLAIDELKLQLAREEQIQKSDERIAELGAQEKSLAQQIADLEASEFLIMQFTKAKIDLIQQKINGRFRYVKFRLFETQLNGGEVECCDTLIDGVPFTDANNAAKINGGLDIINTLCEHHNVYAPIFIDNRESVNELIESNSQIINLIVSTDAELRVA